LLDHPFGIPGANFNMSTGRALSHTLLEFIFHLPPVTYFNAPLAIRNLHEMMQLKSGVRNWRSPAHFLYRTNPMASERQLAANRRNGRLGGPKTDVGKQRSRLNGIKHGLTSSTLVVLPEEHQHEYDEVLRGNTAAAEAPAELTADSCSLTAESCPLTAPSQLSDSGIRSVSQNLNNPEQCYEKKQEHNLSRPPRHARRTALSTQYASSSSLEPAGSA
jgi:hypothetical protein